MSKYHLNSITVSNLISKIENKELLVPEIQRPFVWTAAQVRDFIDSLYREYPVGYIITWQNEKAKAKAGIPSMGSKMIIDGQQRIAAITTAIVGREVVDKNFTKKKIVIAFNPIEGRFETKTPAIEKNKNWISDISILYSEQSTYLVVKNYMTLNSEADEQVVADNIGKLFDLKKAPFGEVELGHELDIEEVSEIFRRVNSKGKTLVQQDFVMSKIASVERYDGVNIRKLIDYFSHLSAKPSDLVHIKKDKEFSSEHLAKVSWVAQKEGSLLYKMDYKEILRVVYSYKFRRGNLKYFVPLLSGRDFEKRETVETLSEERFKELKEGVLDCINQGNYEKFTMIIKSLGFITETLLTSRLSIDFAYSLYLFLKSEKLSENKIEKLVRKWFVFSLLTARYGSSTGTILEQDLRAILDLGVPKFIERETKSNITASFWENNLPQKLDGSSAANIQVAIFTASLVKNNSKAFLSSDISIRDMLDGGRGDLHHIYPKDYLKKNNLSQSNYNQIANRVYCEQPINIKLSNLAPNEYLSKAHDRGFINLTESEVKANLDDLAIPHSILDGTIANYHDFLAERRHLMSLKIKEYFEAL